MNALERQDDLRKRLAAVTAAWLQEGGAVAGDPPSPASGPDGVAVASAINAHADALAGVLAIVVNRQAREIMTKATAIGFAKRVRRAVNDMMEEDVVYRECLSRAERRAADVRRAGQC